MTEKSSKRVRKSAEEYAKPAKRLKIIVDKNKKPKANVQKFKNNTENDIPQEAETKTISTNVKTNKLKSSVASKSKVFNKTKKFTQSKSKAPLKKTNVNPTTNPDEPVDWKEFKKQKKELKQKRKKARAKDLFEIMAEAKKYSESLRRKNLQGGTKERQELVNKVHSLFKDNYTKAVLSHDVSRIIQFMLKYAHENVRKEIASELTSISAQLVSSKYSRYCFKSLLKYGNNQIREAGINALQGHVVELVSKLTSSAIFEYAYSTYATPTQKQNLIQEFFGVASGQLQNKKVKHLKDTYENCPELKSATLSSVKRNLIKVLDKGLLDSGLVQSVVYQFMEECTNEDKGELITQLAPHVTVISNSKDGVKAAMHCLWQSTNKDKKAILKSLKDHVIDLSKHEHGHNTIITLLDSMDDTVLLNKIVLSQVLSNINDLLTNQWGRKILLWLVAPAEKTYFHPSFIKDLETGYSNSTSKKDPITRRLEIREHCRSKLLKHIKEDPQQWLSNASIAIVTHAIIKSHIDDETKETAEALAKVVLLSEWKIKSEKSEEEVLGIEHTGLHMILKKIITLDKDSSLSFGKTIIDLLTDEKIKEWLELNRGCFLLSTIFDNGSEETKETLKVKISSHIKKLRKCTSFGSQVLLGKLGF